MRGRNLVFLVVLVVSQQAIAAEKIDAAAVEITSSEHAVLWRDPADMPSRNLFYGRGGEQHQPAGDYTFVKEDLSGSNPKFVVRDAKGVTWTVKLGIEAKPEVAASRLVWAAGYSADEDYYVDQLHVTGLPEHLHRGTKYEEPGGTFRGARLKRQLKDGEKAGRWKWRENPFVGTREFNGLRTLVAVINDWDVKDVNTAIRLEVDEHGNQQSVFLLSDLGASFGTAGLVNPRSKSKGNLASYESSRFIRKTEADSVDFETPGRASVVFLFSPPTFFSRLRLRWVGRDIPRADARWAGALLGRLSENQIHDAFRAAGFTAVEVDGYTKVILSRIDDLNKL